MADNPLAYWRFEEPSGIALSDEVGNGDAGTAVGLPNVGSPGAFGSSKSVQFDGNDDRVDTSLLQTAATARSLEAWIRTSGPTGYEYSTIITTRVNTGPARSLTLGMGNGATLAPLGSLYIAYDADFAFLGVASVAAYNDNKWHHVVGNWSAASGVALDPSQFGLIIDGVPAATTVRSFCYVGCGASPLTGDGGTTIGSGARNWQGSIDEVAVYDHVLTQARGLAHFNAGVPVNELRSGTISGRASVFGPLGFVLPVGAERPFEVSTQPGDELQVSAIGGMNPQGSNPAYLPLRPDGTLYYATVAIPANNLSGVNSPSFSFLAGMFVGPTPPTSSPPTLPSLTGNELSITPLLGQVFWVGDGFTGGGARQKFVAPAGATRLCSGSLMRVARVVPPVDIVTTEARSAQMSRPLTHAYFRRRKLLPLALGGKGLRG
jgi:Concanavalin A-like lectin/glucanases superfamily